MDRKAGMATDAEFEAAEGVAELLLPRPPQLLGRRLDDLGGSQRGPRQDRHAHLHQRQPSKTARRRREQRSAGWHHIIVGSAPCPPGDCLMQRFVIAVSLIVASLLAEGPTRTDAQQPPQPTGPWHGSGKNGAVATGGQEAMEAGLAMLKSGGNAADAAAVATLVMTVTDPDFVCFGGEIPILFYDAKTQSVEVLCGQGAARRLPTREHFPKKGGIP